MKKLLLSATAFLSVAISLKAQQIQPCGTYQARDYFIKNLPGYAAQLNANEASVAAQYQAYLQKQSQGGAAAKTSSMSPSYTFTIPVVFHILHQGEALGTGSNINDNLCVNALNYVNSDYARMGSDTSAIDPLFKPLYVNSNIHFQLAQKDPNGNCTNGIIHHYDNNTNWSQTDLLNYKYSTYAAGNWNPSKYLNIYIVKNIASSSPVVGGGYIVGYTYLPGTSPVSAADAIVYRNDALGFGGARALSHEIGHWLGLSHTFGSTNDPGFECGNDDIGDTPATTGFFSICPKPVNSFGPAPTVTTPVDSSDITSVKFGKMYNNTALNSLIGYMRRPLMAMVATTVSATMDSSTVFASGNAGEYSNFTLVYGNDYNANTTSSISITSTAKSVDNNYVAVYVDYNNNGSFADAGEAIFTPTTVVYNYSITPIANAYGTLTFGTPLKINKTYTVATGPGTIITTYTTTPDSFITVPKAYIVPSGKYGMYRMRVMTSNTPISGPTMIPPSGEIEEYNLNIGTTPPASTVLNTTMANCSTIRPNIENIMDYSDCPKMFTQGQTDKMRFSSEATIGNRNLLTGELNLYNVGLYNTITLTTFTAAPVPPSTVVTTYTAWVATNPATVSPCAPIADFSSNKATTCEGQSIVYTNTSFNGTGMTYSWEFEGGSPSNSTLAVQSVTYSTPGTYSVSLTATNAYGVSTKTINTITTTWNAPSIPLPYNETFDNGTWWPTGWVVPANTNDIGTPTWELSPYGAGSSTSPTSAHSLLLPNANTVGFFPGYEGTVDFIETPAFDFSNVTSPSFAFDYSFARATGVVADTFKVQYSLDCGGSWKIMPSLPTTAAMAAATGGTVNAPYMPWSGADSVNSPLYKWKTVTIANAFFSSLVQNERSVRFRFWFKNDIQQGLSQNLYLDNINISGTVGIHEFENSLGLSIYPNPTNSASTVEFTSPNNSKVNILVYDVTGRVVEHNELNVNAGVAHKHSVNNSGKLTPGIYFISLTIDNKKVVKKLIIN